MRRALWIVGIGIALAGVAWWLLKSPDPLEILARIDPPPSPVLTPGEEAATFHIAPDFRIELVASEPLIVDPVAMDWDDTGRLYVVEMRGYMPNIKGKGEDEPVGRVVLLDDTNGDGQMDESTVYLDQLVLPRAVAVLPQGVLIGVPPHLILCRDTNQDDACSEDEQTIVGDYAAVPANVEHAENALLPGIDGWIYNSKSARRFRFEGEALVVDDTLFRGQWGLAEDNEGNFFYNHNSAFIQADLFPGEYALRQPATAARIRKPGLAVELTKGAEVYGARVMPGLNRAMQPGTLRPDGRQLNPTGVSGLVVQRGDQYGEVFVGDAFVPEAAGAAVAHFALARQGIDFEAAHRLYKDDEHGLREFLASTDERFRPVDAKVGPDGTVWILDMYRGLIQHADFVSDHLRAYVASQGLEAPGATGRIWRIVRNDRPVHYSPPPLDTQEAQLLGLNHPNGWVRSRAQRRLVAEQAVEAIPALRHLETFTEPGRHHALWTLSMLGGLDLETWQRASADDAPPIRALALRLGKSLPVAHGPVLLEAIQKGLSDPDARVRLQALHSLGDLPAATRPVAQLLESARDGNAVTRQAALSGLGGFELAVFEPEIASAEEAGGDQKDWIESLATTSYGAALQDENAPVAVARLFEILSQHEPNDLIREAALEGFLDAQQLPGAYRVVLGERPRLFDPALSEGASDLAAQVRRGITWPGDSQPGGAHPLSSEEETLRAEGKQLFAATCATCHGENGRGLPGLAPPLVRSPWVRDADEWIVRIVLQGLQGKIDVLGEEWNGSMPGHDNDSRFNDRAIAGLVTYIRRSWGHADLPVSIHRVREIRSATAERRAAWSAPELLSLPIRHRLDRFAGTYRIPVVGIEVVIRREESGLTIGRATGPRGKLIEIGDGLFNGQGVQVRFELGEAGPSPAALLDTGDFQVEAKREAYAERQAEAKGS